MERRALIQWLAVTAGLSPRDLLVLGRRVHRSAAGAPGRVLSAAAARTVTAAAEGILPATETPGATDAAVSAFIDKMLAEWYTPEERDRFLSGVATLDAQDFGSRPAADQATLLRALDAEVQALRSRQGAAAANRHWFAMLKYLTVYGYCTSEVGARALGLDRLAGRYDPCATM